MEKKKTGIWCVNETAEWFAYFFFADDYELRAENQTKLQNKQS